MAAVHRPAAGASATLPRRRGCRGASRLQAAAAATMELTRPAAEGSFPAAASLVADASAEPPQRPRSAEEALAASISRTTVHWTALAAVASSPTPNGSAAPIGAAAESSDDAAARLQQQRQLLEGSAALEPYRFALEEGASDAGAEYSSSTSCSSIDRMVEETLEEWQAVAHQRPKGFDQEASLAQDGVAGEAAPGREAWEQPSQNCSMCLDSPPALPAPRLPACPPAHIPALPTVCGPRRPLEDGLDSPPSPAVSPSLTPPPPSLAAEAAVVTRGGRVHGFWKGANQDAFTLTQASSSSMLLCVCDGHGRRGEAASQAAAERVAAALPACLKKAAGAASSLSSCSSADEPTPASQQALVAALQAAARSINADPAYTECGSAVAACLVEPGRSVGMQREVHL